MSHPTPEMLIEMATSQSIAARFTIEPAVDTTNYIATAVIGVVDSISLLPNLEQGQQGEWVVPVSRAVITSMVPPLDGRIDRTDARRMFDEMLVRYDSKLSLPGLCDGREEVAQRVYEFMHSEAFRGYDSRWCLSVLGVVAFGAAMRGLQLASGIPLQGDEPEQVISRRVLALSGLERRADILYGIGVMAHQRLFEISPVLPAEPVVQMDELSDNTTLVS